MTKMNTITVCRANQRDIQFTGYLLAEVSSAGESSGEPGRWAELKLFKTAAGKMVAQSIGRTQWEGESDFYTAAVCESDEDVVNFFGTGWLAKKLYTAAEINAVEQID